MDGLSLLCNLHADGPLALRRLRAAGVHDLNDLEGLAEASLSACLRSSSTHARRFVEEARQLARRLAESPLEPEPSWEETASLRLAARPAEAPALVSRAEPRTHAARAGRTQDGLEPGAFAGLDERTCERLAAQGVRTLEALHERASLVLARAAGIPYTKLLGLAAHARLARPAQDADPHARVVVPETPRRALSFTGLSVASPPSAHPAASSRRVHASEPGPAGPFG